MSTPSTGKPLAKEAGSNDSHISAPAHTLGGYTPANPAAPVNPELSDVRNPNSRGDEECPLPQAAITDDTSSSTFNAPAASTHGECQSRLQGSPSAGTAMARPQFAGPIPSVLGSLDTIPTGTSPKYESGSPPEARQDAQNCNFMPQQLAGWAAVEKTLTDYDKQEIGGYKEDIDSLLTFAGLYSAVLTAFVIVSFTQLQEDTAAESLKVLRLIANQTAVNVATGGHLANFTVSTPASSSQFQPSAAAIRVNILWFASLVISLSTASFAIFVKQWLRAYMASTSTSPQGQMRIRHLRRSGLIAWRVLGIASTLPLLLQVSLALFFTGLCFFTADIHPAIGNTTIPLVCAWAFLFVAVTLSPIFSVRCPFKTPALASITTALRIHIYVPVIMPWVHPDRMAFALLHAAFLAGCILINKALLAGNLGDRKWVKTLVELGTRFDHFLHSRLRRYKLTHCREENEVARDRSNDLIILASADTAQDNPELDPTTIEATLDQIKPHWSEAIELLVKLIGNRTLLPADFSEGPEGVVIDLKSLSSQTQETIRRLFSRHVDSGLLSSKDSSSQTQYWKAGAWAITVFFSIHGYGPWDSGVPQAASWAYIHQWLDVQCRAEADHANGPQLLLWTCSYISRTQAGYVTEEDLRQDMIILKHAITVSAKKFTALCCGQPASTVLSPLAVRAARRLMESADRLRHPDRCGTYCNAALLALQLCGVVHTAGCYINCEELLGDRLKEIVSLRTQHGLSSVVTSWMSLPPAYVAKHVVNFVYEARHEDHEYNCFLAAINAIAEDAIVQGITTAQILNLSLIALCLERAHTERRAERLSPAELPTSTNRLQIFNYLASALTEKRQRNIYGKNSVHLDKSELEVAKMCWSAAAIVFEPSGSARGLDPNLPYIGYFLVELSSIDEMKVFSSSWTCEGRLFKKLVAMSTEEVQRIRKEGEKAIGRDKGRISSSAGLCVFGRFQDAFRNTRRPRADGVWTAT